MYFVFCIYFSYYYGYMELGLAEEGNLGEFDRVFDSAADTGNRTATITKSINILDIMHKLCRQVSIETPGAIIKDCVFNNFVPIEETPAHGARIKIVCAGACYRRRDRSLSNVPDAEGSSTTANNNSYDSKTTTPPPTTTTTATTCVMRQLLSSPAHTGIREGAFYSGFEVAGVIESLGTAVTPDNNTYNLKIGQRVIVYPFDEIPAGYAELMVVPHLKYIVPIPDHLPIPIAAMLPTGALLAMNAVLKAYDVVMEMLNSRSSDVQNKKCKILIVGTGGLALWAVRIAAYHLDLIGANNYINITVATLRDEGFRLAQEIKNISVVQWDECLYEPQLIERTQNTCGGPVDVVIDFVTTSRSLHRSLHCLSDGGVILISEEVADKLLTKSPRFSLEHQQRIIPISMGSIEQLHDLVHLVAEKKIEPPPHSVFPCEQAADVIQKLCNSEISGRAILRFHDID